jgi:putative ABC transport system permease protein
MTEGIMFKNYLKIAVRNIRKHKGYAFINIAGLAIGMACCILIILYVVHELSYDRFHENADRIYRMGIDAKIGGSPILAPLSNAPSILVLKQDYPEVLDAVRIRPSFSVSKNLVKYEDKQFYEEGVLYADNTLFDIFTFPMIKGDSKTALKTAYSVVLTEEIAARYFGDEDPLGKVLKFNDQEDFTVTGVVKNVPQNSHFTFKMLCSFETLYARDRESWENWFNWNLYAYLLLPENYDFRQLEKKFAAFIEKHIGKELSAVGGELKYFLQPLTSIHLHSNLQFEIFGNSSILYVYIFGAIALFILLIACINFMNLATARSTNRAKEVGLRKVVGAKRKELIRQFLGESLVYSFFSLLIAIVLVELALPFFRSLSGVDLRLSYTSLSWLIPGFLGLILCVGIIAGSYPALFLSRFQPIRVLKGSLKAGAASSRFRSILVVAQFVISISLIIGTAIILNQLNFMKNTSLGFDKEKVLVVQIMDQNIRQSLDSIKAELKRIPGVVNVSASSIVPGEFPDTQPFVPEGFTEKQAQIMESINVDHDFIPTLGIEIVDGRNFSAEFKTDREEAAIINETAAKKFGWDNPVGKTIKAPTSIPFEWGTRRIIGVVKDFHLASLHKAIGPLYLNNGPGYLNSMVIKISPKNSGHTIDMLREKWRGIHPNRPFDYFFLGDSFDSQYDAEERLSDLVASFAILAIFVACLGLFGMASFAAEQRTKEIGIRKVLGASVPGVVALISKDFLKIVGIANIVAWPMAYFVMKRWLQGFAYRTSIELGVFILTGFLALAIALITVSYQAIRAALANPVDSLRYE